MNVQEICEYLVSNVNEDVNADQLADEFHYNKFYLMRKFKEYTGFTISEFINECRVYNSINSLIFTDNSILKIALTNGFNSLEYYSEKFRDIIGTSPLKFRQVYSKLLALADLSEDSELLKYIKMALDELQGYQYYLNNIGDVSNDSKSPIEKPKIKAMKVPFSNGL